MPDIGWEMGVVIVWTIVGVVVALKCVKVTLTGRNIILSFFAWWATIMFWPIVLLVLKLKHT